MSARTAILPATFTWRSPKGVCHYCGEATTPRSSWHPACVTAFKVAKGSLTLAIPSLVERDGRDCQRCGRDLWGPLRSMARSDIVYERGRGTYREDPWCPVEWGVVADVDHKVPLWRVDRDDPEAWRFWTLDNLHLLCRPCHKAKTAEEAGERAAMKRQVRARTASLPLLASVE